MASKNQDKDNQGNSSNNSGGKSQRGFASMDPDQQREIASEGGRAAHQAGTAHEFTSEEARKAGQQSHKNDASKGSASSTGNRGSESSSKTRGGADNQSEDSGSKTRGGTPEQHAEAGKQSHKNQK